jgi:hypothetical protein
MERCFGPIVNILFQEDGILHSRYHEETKILFAFSNHH